MVISKNLKEFVSTTIHKKVEEVDKEIWEKKKKVFDTIRDELNAIQEKAMDKCIKIFEEKGLAPEDFGYFPYHEGCRWPEKFPSIRARYSFEHDIIQEILIKFELDEVPKNQVIDFVNNYDVSKYFEK
ncbi:MAG: hypothetical protein LIR46_12935 [Bacteroidota bacterium]|nr:hypothetical protein [Bacteroidota bacterium]